MTRFATLMLALLAALLLGTACGGSSGGTASGGAESKQQIRDVLEKLVIASQANDLAGAKPHLDVGSFLLAAGSADASRLGTMSAEELAKHTERAFNQLKCVGTESKLTTPAAIRASLAAAQITVYSEIKRADVLFKGPDSQSSGEVSFRVKLTLAIATGWKLQTISTEY